MCFLYESIFWELILWLCVGMQKGVLGNVSCRAYLQLVVPNARLIGKLLSEGLFSLLIKAEIIYFLC